jgi:hypothetical protein
MAKKQGYKQTKFDLVVFGEFFSDMIFYNLRRRPRFSEESKTESFLIAPGGGLATTAIAASRLGTRTGVITRIGADAEYLPTWTQIAQEKLDISACEYRKDLPTALTVCIAYKADRMMVTHEPITITSKICSPTRPCKQSSRKRATFISRAPFVDRPSGFQSCAISASAELRSRPISGGIRISRSIN